MVAEQGPNQNPISRRQLIGRAGATLGAVVTASGSSPGYGGRATAAPYPTSGMAEPAVGDEYDLLRQRWYLQITGEPFDPSDPAYGGAIDGWSSLAADYLSLLDRSPGRDQVFTDLPITQAESRPVPVSFRRLLDITTAYATPGTDVYQDAGVRSDVLAGLRTMNELIYNDRQEPFGNWFHWQIAAPFRLLDTCTLLYDHIEAADLAAYLAAVDNFLPVVRPEATYTNRSSMCRVIGIRGVLGKSADKIEHARQEIAPVFTYTESGDGFYRDGSFIFHRTVPYTGSYGVGLLGAVERLVALFAGTSWSHDDVNVGLIYDAIDRTYSSVMFNGQVLDFVQGRHVDLDGRSYISGHKVIEVMLRLAASIGGEDGRRWKERALGWLERDDYRDILADANIPRITLVKQLLAEPDLAPTQQPAEHRVFPAMARAVHRRPGWCFAIAMSSERVAHYEMGRHSRENVRGFHQGSGVTYVYTNADLGHYADVFWRTVDPYRLPGITVDSQRLPDGAGDPNPDGTGNTVGIVATNSHAGGAVLDGRYGAVGHDLHPIGTTLQVHKSWFCLDEYVVALGAGIGPGSGAPIETVLENRNLHENGTNALLVDGVEQPVLHPWSGTFERARWTHIGEAGGYVLLDTGASTLTARREKRTSDEPEPRTRRYLTLWLDHGPEPDDETYAYLVVPGATPQGTAAIAAEPGVRVLANRPDMQAAHQPATGLTMANFFAAAELSPPLAIAADGPCSVVARRHDRRLRMALADPTLQRASMSITIWPSVYGSWKGDGTVRVATTRPEIVIEVDTSDLDGRSHTVQFMR